jgi:hypothetical protein
MNKGILHIILGLVFLPMTMVAQNKHNIEADIERAVKEFFFKVSEMNNPVEPIRPEDFASAYQKGINVFQINSSDIKMIDFLVWYKNNVLEDFSISHEVRIKSIKPLQENNRYYIEGVLLRKIEDDTQRRRVKEEPLYIKVLWRGQEYNNVSFQSIAFNLNLSFLKPDVKKEYELSLDHIVSHLSSKGGNWKFEIISNIKSMEGFDDDERTCIDSQPANVIYYNQDDIDIKANGFTLSGYVGPNKSKIARCFLIVVEQEDSKKLVCHYIYQGGKQKRSKK